MNELGNIWFNRAKLPFLCTADCSWDSRLSFFANRFRKTRNGIHGYEWHYTRHSRALVTPD
jgi:hypothetical protein